MSRQPSASNSHNYYYDEVVNYPLFKDAYPWLCNFCLIWQMSAVCLIVLVVIIILAFYSTQMMRIMDDYYRKQFVDYLEIQKKNNPHIYDDKSITQRQ